MFGRKYTISPENLADMVYKWIITSGEGQAKASEKVGEFLNLIKNPDRKVYYAEKFQNYDIAMDVSDWKRLVVLCFHFFSSSKTIANNLRDRGELENLRRRIPQDHPSYVRATSLLEVNSYFNEIFI